MTLKYKLESLEGLSESQAGLYEERDGAFYLSVEGMPQNEDVSGLKAKVDQLLSEKKAEQDARKEQERLRREAEAEKAKKDGDFESLASSYEKTIQDLKDQIKENSEKATKAEISRQASVIASELAGKNSELLIPFVEQRLRMEDGELKVTDEKGNLTISTLDQLKEEFRNNAKFGAVVIASEATGSGASGTGNGGGAVKKFSEMNEKERVELYRSNKAEYERLRDAEK